MPYIVKKCSRCGAKYHVHLNAKGKIKKITGACEHIKMSKNIHSKKDVYIADANELDKMVSEEYEKSKK